MADKKKWHSWVIKRNRIDYVIEFIQANCPEIDKFFYPQIKKEYTTEELTAKFEVIGFGAGYCVVKDKVTGKKGSFCFFHSPRIYFDYVEA